MQYYIEVAISIVFVYLSLSVVTSIVLEFFSTIMNLRGRELRKAIYGMMDESGVVDALTRRIEKSPLLQSFRRSSRRTPSYIDSASYASSLLNNLPDYHSLGDLNTMEFRIKSMQKSDVKQVLLEFNTFMPDELEKKVAAWYDQSMDRFKGHFKRFVKKYLVLIGFIIAAAINADSIRVFHLISENASLRDNYISEATEVINTYKSYQEYVDEKGKELLPEEAEQLSSVFTKASQIIEDDLNKIAKAEVFGWSKVEFTEKNEAGIGDFQFWGLKLLGIMLSALAISMGGPFWYDVLAKITPLGGKGNKPKKVEEGS